MRVQVDARSISRPVWEQLEAGSFTAQVLAVFEHACNLITPDDDVIALVLPQVGDGPLNIVVAAKPSDLAALEPGIPAWLQERRLTVGAFEVALETAAVWEPCPDWDRLRTRQGACADRLSPGRALSLQHAPEGSLLSLVSGLPGADSDPEPAKLGLAREAVFAAAREAAETLLAGWREDAALLQAGAGQLAGLGGGLTPAGDDFLSGVMLWAWLAHADPDEFCRLVVETAVTRTTTLSTAFLRAAARGECSAAWHSLLAVLADGTDEELATAVQGVLAHGATSGADALAGFLWAGLSAHTKAT